MTKSLVVVRPFGRHARGDTITDTGEIAAVLQSEHARSVVCVMANEVPASVREEI